MRTKLALTLLLMASGTQATNPYGYLFTVSTNPVPPGSNITITIQTTEPPCRPLPDTLFPVPQEDGVVLIGIPDSDGCEVVPLETRSYSVAPLPAGNYTFRFYACGGLDVETGEEACTTLEDVPVTVFGLSATRTVPTISVLAGAALGALLLLLARRRLAS